MDSNKVCFIIAHKYFRGYPSYLKHYISNIQKFYPEAMTVVVDNNSTYKHDVFSEIEQLDNLVLLDNDITSKFELGAYQVGVRYIVENNLVDQYEYFVFTQDNCVLKNKYDFNTLKQTNTYALPVNSFYADGECKEVCDKVLNTLKLNDNLDKINFCWCSNFVVASSKIEQLYGYLKQIVVLYRWESCAGERYLARILWELNEQRECGDIDGSAADLAIRHYDTWSVNIYDSATSYFVKKVQQKTENTVDSNEAQKVAHVPADKHRNDYNANN